MLWFSGIEQVRRDASRLPETHMLVVLDERSIMFQYKCVHLYNCTWSLVEMYVKIYWAHEKPQNNNGWIDKLLTYKAHIGTCQTNTNKL